MNQLYTYIYPLFLLYLILFLAALEQQQRHVGAQFPDQAVADETLHVPGPFQWKPRVLTTGPQGRESLSTLSKILFPYIITEY